MEDQEIGTEAHVTLREITKETVLQICGLSDTLAEPQHKMVAPNAISISQAHFSDEAWFRAIYADEVPVGFVMLYDNAEKPEYFLWRFMIAGDLQPQLVRTWHDDRLVGIAAQLDGLSLVVEADCLVDHLARLGEVADDGI